MTQLNYGRFYRALVRCKDLGTSPTVKPLVAKIYASSAKEPIETFIDLQSSIDQKQSAASKEDKEAQQALAAIDAPYKSARAAALAMVPTLVIPDTLKRQPTLTDKVIAVEKLLDIVDDYVGQPWADEVLSGEFGQLAPKVIQEINESLDADVTLSGAKAARAAGYGPAYESYLAFKRVVRAQYGASSLEYRRIHIRESAPSNEEEGEEAGGDGSKKPE